MPRQDPPFPSISLVLSQSASTSYLMFPWTSITYQEPFAPAAVAAYPIPVAQSQQSAVPTPNTLPTSIEALRQFFANIVTRLKARITT
ncbi:hypothetical protein MSAN_00805600 [Mycena sanguinolenta]|uniref:Uncharacterized protein n=1 Tax=Mycena sanguinolenta TaxID=230812 RepID=A0A8H6Z142_9AGAR|nr:hypothetical protein MSAN_00805600 [Mycena sanguinolenta]